MAAVGELYRITYQFLAIGQTIENVLHFRARGAASTPAQMRTSAEQFFSLWKSMVANDVQLAAVHIKQLTPAAFDEDVFQPTVHTVGAAPASAGNLTVAIVWTLRTGESGKSKRGRMYIGGLTGGVTALSTLSAPNQATMDNAALAVVAEYGPNGANAHFELGVYSRTIGGSNPATIAGYRPVTQIISRNVLGNQRRRRIGVGM